MRRVAALLAVLSVTCVACFQNGQIPDDALTTVTPSCRIVNDVAPRLQALLDAAHADGVALWPETKSYAWFEPPRITSCYRDLEMQEWWRGYWCLLEQCGNAAVPGTSVHGWGRAVDFEDGGGELRFDSAGFGWLWFHAAAYGFFLPEWAGPSGSNPEAWHWEAA
ncbi:MAG TPA: M15 family metallopeptidase [Acidimicrobiia bacterium]|nr:M15 family metallopeptidase [Acidimicrobiia bacterium]